MSETKFTKGPWAVVHLPDGTIRIDSDDVPEMAYIYEETGAESERIARANLIAAAPEMYATLQDVLGTFERQLVSEDAIQDVFICGDDEHRAMRIINDVLAKARGE